MIPVVVKVTGNKGIITTSPIKFKKIPAHLNWEMLSMIINSIRITKETRVIAP